MMCPIAVAKKLYLLPPPRSPQDQTVLAIKVAVIFPPVDENSWRPLRLAIEAKEME